MFVLLHEMCHYLAARKFGYFKFNIRLMPIGAALNLENLDNATPREDIIISLCGPLLNLILALFFFIMWNKFNNSFLYSFYRSNLALGLFNLLPAYPLDGGRILRDILCIKKIYKIANRITAFVSISVGSILIIIYFALFFQGIYNINLGLIALFIIVISIKENERIAYFIMGDIIKKKYKFYKKGFIQNASTSIHYKKDILTALGLMDKNKYSIFLVLDDEMQFIDIVYEQEIIEALKNYGNISLEKLLLKKK